jgi:hypothetical protein
MQKILFASFIPLLVVWTLIVSSIGGYSETDKTGVLRSWAEISLMGDAESDQDQNNPPSDIPGESIASHPYSTEGFDSIQEVSAESDSSAQDWYSTLAAMAYMLSAGQVTHCFDAEPVTFSVVEYDLYSPRDPPAFA